MLVNQYSTMLKAFKYRLYPNHVQEAKIIQTFGAVRYVYNWSLEQKIKAYETKNKTISRYELDNMLPDLKTENEWLKDVNAQTLQQANKRLDSAFTKFFREKQSFPKFKSRKNPVQSFQIPQNYTVDFENDKVKLPKMGWINAVLHRDFVGTLKTATVSLNRIRQFHISILVDDEKDIPGKELFTHSSTVGVDVGIKHFATFSDGTKVDNPKHLINSSKRLEVLQRRLSRKHKGSNNRNKARHDVAKIHNHIANQRKDFLHKLSLEIVRENQAIAVETLNVSGMMKNHCLARAISDAAWSEFFGMVKYKAEWYGKTVIHIGQFEPSSKICNVCGTVNKTLTLSDRTWICESCNTTHDRDINASINIKNIALQPQNLISISSPAGRREGPVGGANIG